MTHPQAFASPLQEVNIAASWGFEQPLQEEFSEHLVPPRRRRTREEIERGEVPVAPAQPHADVPEPHTFGYFEDPRAMQLLSPVYIDPNVEVDLGNHGISPAGEEAPPAPWREDNIRDGEYTVSTSQQRHLAHRQYSVDSRMLPVAGQSSLVTHSTCDPQADISEFAPMSAEHSEERPSWCKTNCSVM